MLSRPEEFESVGIVLIKLVWRENVLKTLSFAKMMTSYVISLPKFAKW